MEKDMATTMKNLGTKETLGSQALDEEKDLEARNDPPTTLLHVYHYNKEKSKSYAIHTLRDSSTSITLPEKKFKKNKKTEEDTPISPSPPQQESPQTQQQHPGLWKRISTQAARAKAYDNPDLDPRCSTASSTILANSPLSTTAIQTSYFLHLPTLYFHCPPYTLRKGGNKRAPVTALITPSWIWREWKLEFGDILNEEGVIDGRGIVNASAGAKEGKDGTLKGYANRKRRWWGESGKKWFYESKTNMNEITPKESGKEKELKEPKRADEIVDVKWVAPLKRAREYRFSWRGCEFVWKGTGMVGLSEKKFARFRSVMTRFSHLKLVVVVPGTSSSRGMGEEIVLARYTSTMAKRKAGRLEIFDEAVDAFMACHGSSLSSPQDLPCSSIPPVTEMHSTSVGSDDIKPKLNEKHNPFEDPGSPTRDLERVRERLRDLIVASGICMIVGEFEKREVLYAFLLMLLEATQNGGG